MITSILDNDLYNYTMQQVLAAQNGYRLANKTALDALKQGYQTVVPANLCRAVKKQRRKYRSSRYY